MKSRIELLTMILLPVSIFAGIYLVKNLVKYPWKEVACNIKSGEIVTPDDKHDPKLTHRAEIVFSCDDPNRGIYMWEDFASETEAREFLARYKPGAPVTGYEKGSEITLRRKPLWTFSTYFIPFVLFLILAAKLQKQKLHEKKQHAASFQPAQKPIVSRKKMRTFDQSTASVLEDSFQQVELRAMYAKESSPNSRGLKPRRAQLTQFVGLLAGAIIVSAMAGYAGFAAYQTWKTEQSAGLAVAAAPFLALFSFGLIRRAIAHFLGLLNPRPNVQLGSVSTWPGGNLDLSWRYEGKFGAARKIMFSLIGIEKIEIKEKTQGTYRYSTSSGLAAKVVLYESTQDFEIREGRSRIKIPENLMHSFDYSSMKIEWTLRVEVKIGFWTDLHEEYSIQILPVPLSSEARM